MNTMTECSIPMITDPTDATVLEFEFYRLSVYFHYRSIKESCERSGNAYEASIANRHMKSWLSEMRDWSQAIATGL